MHETHGWSNQGVKVWLLSMTLLAPAGQILQLQEMKNVFLH